MVMPACCERHDQGPIASRGTDGSLADRNSFFRQDTACFIDCRRPAHRQLDRAQQDDAAGFGRIHQKGDAKV